MRSLSDHKRGSVDIILMAVVASIVIAVSLIIVFSVVSGLDTTTADANIAANIYTNTSAYGGTPAANASSDLVSNLETFYTISPIYLVVLAAVAIIAAVMMIMVKRK